LKNENTTTDHIPTVDDVIQGYTRRVESEWLSRRVAILWGEGKNAPPNMDSKYRELFPMVKESIRKRVKALLDNEAVRKEAQSQQTTETQKKIEEKKTPPEEKPKTPADTPEEVLVSDVTIDLDYRDGKIFVRMLIADQPFELILDPEKQYEESMRTMEEKISLQFRQWIAKSLDNKGKVQFNVVIRVFNGRVYYGFVSNLRECLKSTMESMGNKNLEIQWTDRLYKRNE
jgi:hypothetical protein